MKHSRLRVTISMSRSRTSLYAGTISHRVTGIKALPGKLKNMVLQNTNTSKCAPKMTSSHSLQTMHWTLPRVWRPAATVWIKARISGRYWSGRTVLFTNRPPETTVFILRGSWEFLPYLSWWRVCTRPGMNLLQRPGKTAA